MHRPIHLDYVTAVDMPLQSLRREKPRDVNLGPIIAYAWSAGISGGFIALGIAAALQLSTPVLLAAVCLGFGIISLVGLRWGLALQSYEIEERQWQPVSGMIDGQPVVAVEPQTQVAPNTLRLGGTGSLDGFIPAKWQKLAVLILRAEKLSRAILEKSGLWSNLNGPGRVENYLYQDIYRDMRWLGWINDANDLTTAGRAWFEQFQSPHPQSPVLKSAQTLQTTTQTTAS